MSHEERLSRFHFTRLREADLPQMVAWFDEPVVARWYGVGQRGMEALRARYLPMIRGEVETRGFLMHMDDSPIGFIKTYHLRDYPQYAAKIDAEAGWAGIDYFVGEPAARGRGLAREWLRAFIGAHVFTHADVVACVASPRPENLASCGALRSAGFEALRVVAMPGDDPDEHLHLLHRAAVMDGEGSG